MAPDKVIVCSSALDILIQHRSIIKHRYRVTIRYDIECEGIQLVAIDRRIERPSRNDRVRAGQGNSRLGKRIKMGEYNH
jgi:hypothetical protein